MSKLIPVPRSHSTLPPAQRSPRLLIALLIFLSVLIAGAGYAYYQEQKKTIQQAAQEHLGAMADLKAQDIARWLKERRLDAASLYFNRSNESISAFLENPKSATLHEEVSKWLVSLAREHDYRAVMLIDAHGQAVLSFPPADLYSPATTLDEQTRSIIKSALANRQVMSSDILGNDFPHLDFVVPLLMQRGSEAPPIGALVLRVDLGTTLFPLIEQWPTPHSTTEFLIMRREKNNIVFLGGKAVEQGAAASLSGVSPLVGVTLPEPATETNGTSEVYKTEVSTVDYRGENVLAAIRNISNSPWYLVAKIDWQEINEPIRKTAWRIAGIVALLIVMVSLLLWMLWHRQIESVLRKTNASLAQEITERKYYEEQLERQANHDALTGLPNRNLLQDRLERAIAHAHRTRQFFAVLFLDLDRFKTVNDSLGHLLGDNLLKAVALRLKDCVREDDTVARLGGDEFVMVLEDLEREDLAAVVSRKVLETLLPPFTVEGYEFFVTSSIGISLFPKDGRDPETLLKNADIAMYHAKDLGRNNFQFYAQEMNARTLERLVMENNLRYALERDELELYYQPQVDVKSGAMVGVEALLRWHHPKLGMISPGEFIPLAEETGLIIPIGEWAIRTACAQLKAWQKDQLPVHYVAVNLSPRQFAQAGLTNMIGDILEEHTLQGPCLELEITEGLLMRDVDRAITTLRDLKDMDIQLSVDDFGTGYSSLNYLKRFPLDRLKIDKSFVNDITTDPDDAAITLAVIAMAHSLRLRVIAEGVETEEQLKFLKSKQCDELQGYYFSRPLPSAEIGNLFRTAIAMN